MGKQASPGKYKHNFYIYIENEDKIAEWIRPFRIERMGHWNPCSANTVKGFSIKECVAVFIELYKNTVAVLCVGSDFLSDWTLYTANGIHNNFLHGF